MLFFEDYSNAVFWRISAIFATIAALFSVAVVLWFLIFRAIPDLPDATDSAEQLRFSTTPPHAQRNANLISELTHAFRHFPRLTTSSQDSLKDSKKQAGFFNRLAYFCFGSSSSSSSSSSSKIMCADSTGYG